MIDDIMVIDTGGIMERGTHLVQWGNGKQSIGSVDQYRHQELVLHIV